MPNTYSLISSNVLTSTTASVTFSAIPNTYTDLVVRVSQRNDGTVGNFDQLSIRLNASGTTTHSRTQLKGDGSAATSTRTSNASTMTLVDGSPTANATANTFASSEFYIPNYAGSTSKPVSGFNGAETNATAAELMVIAGLYNSTNAVTDITIDSSGSFVSGSSFYLYGIKNS
jgi:asparagine N-glycosylation enzyme membrane subunit Stt3